MSVIKNKKLVLSLEWTSYPSRDTETATLVRNYLRLNGVQVISGSVHNAYRLINKYRPDLVYMTNIIGASINFRVACFCRSKNIKLVTGISEGDIKEHEAIEMVWGHNSMRFPVETEILLWSEYQRKKFIEQNFIYKKIAQVTGNSGADRYKICVSSNVTVDRTGVDLIVGVGCFVFPEKSPGVSGSFDDKNNVNRSMIEDRHLFSENLDKLVSMMPNVMFLLKLHPGGLRGEYGAGIEKAARRRNVKVISKDASIFDCIATSDVWMSYESNTAMEAWLMNKPTGLLNPTGTSFPRSDFHKGQPNFATATQWRDALESFLQNSELPGFKELENERKRIIKKVIGWSDGLNHVRSGNAILRVLSKSENQISIHIPQNMMPNLKEQIKQTLRFIANQMGLIKSVKKWSNKELAKFEAIRMQEQIIFYHTIGSDWREILKNIN